MRSISHVTTTHDEEQTILVNQRKNRPTSPHITIWKFELPMILSSLHRITGVAMAGGFYALTCGYAASSILGLGLTGTAIASSFAALPLAAKLLAKSIMAYPFVFHSFNGVRHLIWDFGKELQVKQVFRTGYIVVGLTAVFGSYLAFF